MMCASLGVCDQTLIWVPRCFREHNGFPHSSCKSYILLKIIYDKGIWRRVVEGRDEETPKDKLESVKKRTNKRDHRDFNTLLSLSSRGCYLFWKHVINLRPENSSECKEATTEEGHFLIQAELQSSNWLNECIIKRRKTINESGRKGGKGGGWRGTWV